jgi:hypothetical protein
MLFNKNIVVKDLTLPPYQYSSRRKNAHELPSILKTLLKLLLANNPLGVIAPLPNLLDLILEELQLIILG